jgi:hypothetical protein
VNPQRRPNTARHSRNQRSADFQVCCIAGFQTRRPHDLTRPAFWEIGDTAGLETRATVTARDAQQICATGSNFSR